MSDVNKLDNTRVVIPFDKDLIKRTREYQLRMNLLKTNNPSEYNRLKMLEAVLLRPTSEMISYVDNNGQIQTVPTTSGKLSGSDPVGEFVIGNTALNPVAKAIGTGLLYGAGRMGNNWARATLINRAMTPSKNISHVLNFETPTNYERIPFTKYGVNTANPKDRTLVMKHWLTRYPNSGLQKDVKLIDVGNNDMVYKMGDLPLSQKVQNVTKIMELRINKFPAREGYDTSWNYLDGKGMVGGGVHGYFNTIRNTPTTLFMPTKQSNNYEGFHNSFGSFIKANPWRTKPYDYTQIHEGVSHPTDRLVKELVTPVRKMPVMDLYKRISNPSDLFDLSILSNFYKDSFNPAEARATNWEMIMRIYSKASKDLNKPIEKVTPEEFNTFVDLLNSPEKLSQFMKSFNNLYLLDYSNLLDLNSKSSNEYYKRIKSMLKSAPMLGVPFLNNKKGEP